MENFEFWQDRITVHKAQASMQVLMENFLERFSFWYSWEVIFWDQRTFQIRQHAIFSYGTTWNLKYVNIVQETWRL